MSLFISAVLPVCLLNLQSPDTTGYILSYFIYNFLLMRSPENISFRKTQKIESFLKMQKGGGIIYWIEGK